MSFARRPVCTRLVFSWVLLVCLAMHTAFACSPGAITRKQLMKTDVIAVGTIHIVEEREERNGSENVIEGIAELRVRRVLKNRTALVAPFKFRFDQTKVDGCVFGEQPLDGSLVKVYLSRLSPGVDDLGLFHIESMESR